LSASEIVLGHDAVVLAWLKARHGMELFPPCVAVGISEGTELIGAVVFNNYTRTNIEASVAGETRAFTPKVIHFCFQYAFGQLGCSRATLRTRKRATEVRQLIERMGFRPEGKMRRYYGDDDAMIYGLLRQDAGRWFKEPKDAV
jgi:RimJ/RimL family protein N-acetyltransferase